MAVDPLSNLVGGFAESPQSGMSLAQSSAASSGVQAPVQTAPPAQPAASNQIVTQPVGKTVSSSDAPPRAVQAQPIAIPESSSFAVTGASIGGATGSIPGAVIGGAAGFGLDYFLSAQKDEKRQKEIARQMRYIERQQRIDRAVADKKFREEVRQFEVNAGLSRETLEFNKASREKSDKSASFQSMRQALKDSLGFRSQAKDSIVSKGFF